MLPATLATATQPPTVVPRTTSRVPGPRPVGTPPCTLGMSEGEAVGGEGLRVVEASVEAPQQVVGVAEWLR